MLLSFLTRNTEFKGDMTMEILTNIPKRIEELLHTHDVLIDALEREIKRAEENNDVNEVIKLSYDINTLHKSYSNIRADYDPYYKRALDLRDNLKIAIEKDDMVSALSVAKQLGHKQTDICAELGLNNGNLSAYKKGCTNRLSASNKEKIYNYIWRLAN